MVETDRTQMKLWRMRFVYWIAKATQRIFNTYFFSTTTVVKRTRLGVRFRPIRTLPVLFTLALELSEGKVVSVFTMKPS